ncbi:hypothetical protein [Streptomyces sp. NPDC019937]|uniref:hypothetical protein n=1 Tax=Streptomyces sp. NPDC019937 TaxID=3154787 RepID=UPI00340ED583
MTTTRPTPVRERAHPPFPLPALVAMACTGFTVITTETLPAGLLPQLAAGLGVSEGGAAFSGLLWGMLAGYARCIVAPEYAGRAFAVAMTGTPVALSAGTPLGAWLASAVGCGARSFSRAVADHRTEPLP